MMCYLLIKSRDQSDPLFPSTLKNLFLRGDIVTVREDGVPLGTLEDPANFAAWQDRDFVVIDLPMVPAMHPKVQAYVRVERPPMELDVDGNLFQPPIERRRRFAVRWNDLPQAAQQKLKQDGRLTIKAKAAYAGPFDYTWQQVKEFFRDKVTGLDETGDLE